MIIKNVKVYTEDKIFVEKEIVIRGGVSGKETASTVYEDWYKAVYRPIVTKVDTAE
jgi:hypothetical protein